ncbi:MAG: serine hydrolase [Eubacteriales bacterium]|nr:serine hydrolase [Eubacteriales bacterium]
MQDFDQRQLQNVAALMDRFVATDRMAGCEMYVARRGRVGFRYAAGMMDREAGRPIAPDTIYRVYSMSKPIAMTALMQLYERGLVNLRDPLSDYIPEFKDMPVAQTQPDGSVELVKQEQPILIRNLCTMTSGLAYPGDANEGAKSMLRLMEETEAQDPGTVEIARLVARGAALSFQPGTHWMYGFSHDIVGALVELISGQRYGDYLREHIFEPIGMPDTDFWVPESKRSRFCAIYDRKDGKLVRDDAPNFTTDYYARPAFESAGGGLTSTVADYARFCQMLLDGGVSGTERLLGRKTIELMATDHLTEQQRPDFNWPQQCGYGYGLGMRTMIRPALGEYNGSVGEFGWDGMAGTWMCVDPKEGMIIVFMQQTVPGDHTWFVPRLIPTVYAALV